MMTPLMIFPLDCLPGRGKVTEVRARHKRDKICRLFVLVVGRNFGCERRVPPRD
jgi:hypothetical protein